MQRNTTQHNETQRNAINTQRSVTHSSVTLQMPLYILNDSLIEVYSCFRASIRPNNTVWSVLVGSWDLRVARNENINWNKFISQNDSQTQKFISAR